MRATAVSSSERDSNGDVGRATRDGGARGAAARSRPPTIKDVAERAGVSKSLVSRVMRGADGVSRRRRDVVLAAAEALGYRPNAAARSLVQQRSYHVGVVVSDLHNPFFAEVMDGIDEVASERGFRTLVATGNRVGEAEAAALETLLELRMDGVVLLAPRLPPTVVARAAGSVPVAIAGAVVRVTGVDVVATDDVRGAELAVEHLVRLGHRRIGMVDGGAGAGAAERRRGYEAAMRRCGLAGHVQIARGDYTEEGGYAGARRLLDGEPPTAIFASNDLAALGALEAIEEAGLAVPAGVSLVGYDNTALASLRHVSLTTVHQPRRQIGEMAMRALLRRIDGAVSRAQRVVLEPRLVARETTGPPRPGRPG